MRTFAVEMIAAVVRVTILGDLLLVARAGRKADAQFLAAKYPEQALGQHEQQKQELRWSGVHRWCGYRQSGVYR